MFYVINYITNRTKFDINKLFCFLFIKTFIKCFNLGYDFIFLDKSKANLINNHDRCWRLKDEEIFFGKKKNYFILAISNSYIILFDLLDENINSYIFLNFLENK